MIKLGISSDNENFGKLVSTTVSLMIFHYLKAFSDEISGSVHECDFYANIWKICVKTMHGLKDPLKVHENQYILM